jgi:hypothetical protein
VHIHSKHRKKPRFNATETKKIKIKKATGNFNLKNKTGKCGFGTVHKGLLKNKDAAVKSASGSR